MTDKQLKDWMERFFDAELTVDEERELYRYLCANEVSAELRKDREVILALCSTAEEDIELPEGAVERLEAMLDGLEEMKEELQTDDSVTSEKPNKIFKIPIPRYLFRAACAAAVVAIVFLAIPYGDNNHTDEATVLAMVDDVDKDTFDNPEEAMQCLMAAYGDMMLAVNTARDNTREACLSLEQSQAVLREMFNVNIN
jgi:hypothetical protein